MLPLALALVDDDGGCEEEAAAAAADEDDDEDGGSDGRVAFDAPASIAGASVALSDGDAGGDARSMGLASVPKLLVMCVYDVAVALEGDAEAEASCRRVVEPSVWMVSTDD